MSYFMENRLTILVVLIIFIFTVYTTESVLVSGKESIDGVKVDEFDGVSINKSYYDGEIPSDTDELNDIWDTLGEIFEFLTFQPMEMHISMTLLFSFIMSIISIITIFIIVSIIYDIIKALPLT